jgi:nicotinate-nucleotide--dimethylbenzimidazole phosphoribosyltransferase
LAAGGAAINQICKAGGIQLSVHPIGLDHPAGDIVVGAAMTQDECARHVADGMAAVPPECDLFGAGEMGIGNTTAAAAIYAALYGGDAARFVGRGTGVDDAGLARKVGVVKDALAHHAGSLGDPIEVLRCLGGREIAAIAGAILAARLRRVPVVLDGYVVTAAAAVLHATNPAAIDHCLAGHCSAEGAHAEVLEHLGLKPLLSLGLRLGEGTGAALAMAVVKAAAACQSGMATFSSAGVANK